LKGVEGDRMNALLCGCGFTMRKLLAVFFLSRFLWRQIRFLAAFTMDRIYRKHFNLQYETP